MEKRDRKIALLLVLAVCSVILFSSCYIAAEADHDCIGENCPICCQINTCENTLKSLGTDVITIAAAVALTFSAAVLSGRTGARLRASTLITLKVKLSN